MEKQEIKSIENDKNSLTSKLLVVIRISGMVKIREDVVETLDRLKLRRKYSCILVNKNKENIMGMIEKVKYYIAYGEIDKKILEKLISERAENIKGRKIPVKIKIEEVIDGLMKGKKLNDFGLKEFFRLHPPRKGIKSKLQYPKGVLGNNKKDINKLVERML